MSNHTPGPWKTAQFNAIEGRDGNTLIATMAEVRFGNHEGRANAALIAAAPALLAALERIAAGDPTHGQFATLAISEARAAIEQATASTP